MGQPGHRHGLAQVVRHERLVADDEAGDQPARVPVDAVDAAAQTVAERLRGAAGEARRPGLPRPAVWPEDGGDLGSGLVSCLEPTLSTDPLTRQEIGPAEVAADQQHRHADLVGAAAADDLVDPDPPDDVLGGAAFVTRGPALPDRGVARDDTVELDVCPCCGEVGHRTVPDRRRSRRADRDARQQTHRGDDDGAPTGRVAPDCRVTPVGRADGDRHDASCDGQRAHAETHPARQRHAGQSTQPEGHGDRHQPEVDGVGRV